MKKTGDKVIVCLDDREVPMSMVENMCHLLRGYNNKSLSATAKQLHSAIEIALIEVEQDD